MVDSVTSNGSQNLTEEQYKALCKQIKQHQLKNGKGKKKLKPTLKAIGQTTAFKKDIIIQQNQVDWNDISTGMPFALDPNGVLIYTKAGTSRALCLNTMSTLPVGGGAVYRVFL